MFGADTYGALGAPSGPSLCCDAGHALLEKHLPYVNVLLGPARPGEAGSAKEQGCLIVDGLGCLIRKRKPEATRHVKPFKKRKNLGAILAFYH